MNRSPTAPRVVILGGGVAGMSCALWLHHLGATPLLYERAAQLGGQLCALPRINRWVLGFPDTTSVELAARYRTHLEHCGIAVFSQQNLLAVEHCAQGYRLHFRDAEGDTHPVAAAALVIATGTRVVGTEIFPNQCFDTAWSAQGQISFHPLDHLANLPEFAGLNIAVIGGGDNAHHTANDIAPYAQRIYLLMRSTPKAQPAIRQRVLQWIRDGKIHEYPHTTLCAIDREDATGMLRLRTVTGQAFSVHRLFVRAGFRPNTDFLADTPGLQNLACDAEGYLCVDAAKRTNLAGIYAIGDVTHPSCPAVVTALADGAIAARALSAALTPS